MKKLKIILEMIKFEHTIFALPLAFIGAVIGSFVVNHDWPTWWQILWITLAMAGARNAAMALNRLIDKQIDKENPRTALRALPAGLLKEKEVVLFIIASFVLLFVSAYQLNMLAVQLLPIAVFFLVFYSYTKRFTWACHLILGITDGLAPLGGYVAVTGTIDWVGLLLFATVGLWIAGFDIIYSCQDHEYDREKGLHSIPSRFGVKKALWMARVLHVLTVAGFVALWYMTDLGMWYLIGIIASTLLLIYEHTLVSEKDLSKVNTAFSMNGILSVLVFVFTLIDLVVK